MQMSWGKALAAVVVLGMLGAATYAFAWDPKPSYTPAPNTAVDDVSAEELEAVAGQRIFFGHMSVGFNILSGLEQLYEARGVASPNLVETELGFVPDVAAGGGVFVHTRIGENRHPYRKLENFDAMLRDGLADRVDVALIKFCYIDMWWESDPQRLFDAYVETMDRLEADYPDVRFIHMTAPLTTGPYGIKDHIKLLVGRNDNAPRQRYNELIRARYGGDDLFDIAEVESTTPGGESKRELHGGYSNDGAHLNDTGAALVAAEFVRVLNRG